MAIEQVLEHNVRELNSMYYSQLRRTLDLSKENKELRRILAILIESISVGEPISLQDLNKIKERIKDLQEK